MPVGTTLTPPTPSSAQTLFAPGRRPGLPSGLQTPVALGAIYLFWGTGYLAIRYTVETIPPFLMAAIRFAVVGALLYVWGRQRGAAPPTRAHWKMAIIAGTLLFLGGAGLNGWGIQFVPSGLTAVLNSTLSMWMVLIDWLWKGNKPSLGVVIGVLLGLVGITLIVDPKALLAGGPVHTTALVGIVAVVLASLLWAGGSLYNSYAPLPDSQHLATGMQMLVGAALLLGASLSLGEIAQWQVSQVTLRSVLSLGYLILFVVLVGFSAFFWLTRNNSPALASTYAYINPLIALFIGWALNDEPLTTRILIACGVTIAGVVLIACQQAPPPRQHAPRRAD